MGYVLRSVQRPARVEMAAEPSPEVRAPTARPSLQRKRPPVFVFMEIAVAVLVVLGIALTTGCGGGDGSAEKEEAIQAADEIVEQYYPEYVGAEQTVSDWEWEDGQTAYLISYSLSPDEEQGYPLPRALNIYLNPETHTIRIEELN